MAGFFIQQNQDTLIFTDKKLSYKYNWCKTKLWCVIIGLLTSACLWQSSISNIFNQISSLIIDDQEEVNQLALAWQDDIDQLVSLLDSQQLPAHLMEENPILRGDEFDVMAVFNILDRIHVLEGYRLAYVYIYDGMGGYPVLYAYEEGTQPFLSNEEYLSARPNCVDHNMNAAQCNILPYIVTDGSELGYLQLILLDQVGEQFYLYWHSAYRDIRFITTQAALYREIDGISDPFIPLTTYQVRKAKRIDPTPEVRIDGEQIIVRTVWFTHWGGFFESRYTLNKDQPHEIIDIEINNLVEYDCGIMF